MRKEIFESEDEARKIHDILLTMCKGCVSQVSNAFNCSNGCVRLESTMKDYVKKSELEEQKGHKIFNSTDEAKQVIKDTVLIPHKYDIPYENREHINKYIFDYLDGAGFIKSKTELEKAKKEYYEFFNGRGRDCKLGEMDYRASQYIQGLEAEQKELQSKYDKIKAYHQKFD